MSPGYAHPAMEFRPGVIPLRPLNLSDLYGAVIKAIRGNVAATMGLAFVTTLIFLVPTTALGAWIASQESLDFESTEDVFPVAGTIGSVVPSLGTSLSAILLTGFVAFVISQAVMGRKVTAGQTWEGTRGRLPALVGATIVTGLAITLALAAVLVLPVLALVAATTGGNDSGIAGAVVLTLGAALVAIALALFLSTRLAFVGVAVVLEKASVGQGIARSWRLTSGSQFWRVLGIRILTGIIVGIAAQILTVPLSIIGTFGVIGTGDPSDMFVWQSVIAGVTGLITGALTTPFTAGVDALLYVDQRIRREGFDVQLITAAQDDATRQWPGAALRR
ncbi:hypothetical protein [Pedococcus bigeumensis]|uniref:DUF7847 domain-containing protein n=1 Tax=Pedococcus bigeumensis TaxID=433644 RepID=A0A502D243_9MICO|nr:hypothetical protein [Pedococcus bigeumensis]TPG19153.1 hypothetical protein EAH86_01155 [Pedococcus bigeumensis]